MRPRFSRVAAGVFGIAAVLACFATAHAQAGSVAVRVDYRGPTACAEASGFVEPLLARSAHIRIAVAREPAVELGARVTVDARGAHGRLVVHDFDGTTSERDVDGATCESVVTALALVAALAVDRVASSRGASNGVGDVTASADAAAMAEAGSRAPDESSDAGDGGDAGVALDAAATETARPPPDSSAPAHDRTQGTVVARARDVALGWHLALGVGAGAESGAAPSLVASGVGFIEVTRTRASSWSPSARLAFEHADSGEQSVAHGGVRFVRNAARLDLCPFRWTAFDARFTPCFFAEGGAVEASGSGISPARSELRPWASLGALVRLRYVVLSPLFIELDGGVRFPLVRDRFFFEPASPVFEPPIAGGFASVLAGVTIL